MQTLSSGLELGADFSLFNLNFNGYFLSETVGGQTRWKLAAAARDIKFATILRETGLALPPELSDLPELTIERLLVQIDGDNIHLSGALTLTGAPSLALGDTALPLAALDFSLTRAKIDATRTATRATLNLSGDFPAGQEIAFTSDFKVQRFKLAFAYDDSGGVTHWTLAGGIGLLIFGRPLALSAGYHADETGSTFRLLADYSQPDSQPALLPGHTPPTEAERTLTLAGQPLLAGRLEFEINRYTDGRPGAIHLQLAGQMFGATASLSAHVQEALTLKGDLRNLDIAHIAEQLLDAPLPPEAPLVILEQLTFEITPASGDFSLHLAGSVSAQWPILSNVSPQASLTWRLQRTAGQFSCHLHAALTSPEPITIIPGQLALNNFNLNFALANSRDWAISGEISADVLEAKGCQALARYQSVEGQQTLLLAVTTGDNGLNLLDIDGIGLIRLDSLLLLYSHEPAGNSWLVAGSGAVKLENALSIPINGGTPAYLLDVEAAVQLFHDAAAGKSGLIFRAKKADLSLPLLVPGRDVRLDVSFGAAKADELLRWATQAEAPGGAVNLTKPDPTGPLTECIYLIYDKEEGFSFGASVNIKITGLPQALYKVIPAAGTNATFTISSKGAELSVDRITEALKLQIPPIPLSETSKLDLGYAVLDVANLKVTLGRQLELSVNFGVGIPTGLNKIFGLTPDPDHPDHPEQWPPSLELFNTYNPADHDKTIIWTEVAVGTRGVSVTLTGTATPFKAIKLTEETDSRGQTTSWVHLNLQEFGEVRFQMPVLALDVKTNSFKASGGFVVERPLSLPLMPFIALLELAGAEELAGALPGSLSLYRRKQFAEDKWPTNAQALPTLLDADGRLDVDAMLKSFTTLSKDLKLDIPPELNETFKKLGDMFNDLPPALRDYLEFEIPTGFTFDLSVTPDGGARVDIGVPEGHEPIKLLFPGMFGPLPVLQGLELRHLAFGEILGGQFFLLEVDAVLDQFDLASLAAAMINQETGSPLPLAAPGEIHRRIIIKDLFMLIDYKAVATVARVPVPLFIPIFYEQLALEMRGVEGAILQAHAAFPRPEFDAKALGQLILQLKDFFMDAEARMSPEKLGEAQHAAQNEQPVYEPTKMDLRYTLERNYLELPGYMGGDVIGMKEEKISLSALEIIASLLNGFKFFEVNPVIQALPLEKRIGHKQITPGFLPITLSASWLVTTPDEFRIISGSQIKQIFDRDSTLSQAEVDAILPELSATLKLLPPTPQAQSQRASLQERLDSEQRKAAVIRQELAAAELAARLAAEKKAKLEADQRAAAARQLAAHLDIERVEHGQSETTRLVASLEREMARVRAGNLALDLCGRQHGDIKQLALTPQHIIPPPNPATFDKIEDHLQIKSSPAFNVPALTLELWFNRARSGKAIEFLIGRAVEQFEIHLGGDGGSNGIRFIPTPDVHLDSGDNAFTPQSWTHLACVYDPMLGIGQMFINGEPVALKDSGPGPLTTPLTGGKADLFIARRGDGNYFFGGQLAEVRLWRRARSQAEIKADMRRRLTGVEVGLVGYWPLDIDAGLATDFCGQHHALLKGTGLLQFAPLPPQDCLTFDGSDDYIALPDDPFANDHTFTIAAWVKPVYLDDGAYHGFLGHQADTRRKPSLWLASSNRGLHYDSYDPHGNRYADVLHNFALAGEDWLHVAWVKEGNKYRFYRNGEFFDDRPAPDHFYHGLEHGYWFGRVDNFWRGELAEIHIWSVARTESEIRAEMHQRLSGDEVGLMGYWPLSQKKTALNLASRSFLRPEPQPFVRRVLNGPLFDGRNDAIDCGSDPALALTGNLTLQMWVKPHDISQGRQGLIFKHHNNEFEVIMEPGGQVSFYHGDGGWEEIHEPSEARLQQETWQHLAVTRTTADKTIRFYLNGQPAGPPVNFSKTPAASSYPVIIGCRPGDFYFNGQIADVRLWATPRSQAEIQADMRRALTGREPYLAAWWPLDEGIGQRVFDGVGRSHGQLRGPRWHDAAAWRLNGIGLNGQQQIEVGAHPALSVTDDLTLEAWVNPQALGQGRQGLISKHYDFEFDVIMEPDGQVSFYHGDGGWEEILEPPQMKLVADQWQHIAITRKMADRTLRFYLNGRSAGQAGFAKTPRLSRHPVTLGNRTGADNFFTGKLAEVRIWNEARTSVQIRATMRQPLSGTEPGLVGYWPFGDGASGQPANLAQWMMPPQRSYLFDGSDYVELPADPFANDDAFTLALWVKPARLNDGAYHGFIGHQAHTRKPSLWLTAGDNGGLHYDSYDLNGPRFAGVIGGFFEAANQWQHVAWVKSGQMFHFYRNGQLVDSRPAPERFYHGPEFGYWFGRVDNFWQGELAEVHIWSVARTAQEIQAEMTQPLLGDEPGLTGYWPLSRTSGDRLPNRANPANAGAPYGLQWAETTWPAWRGLAFDGLDDRLDCGANPALAIAGDLTIEAWVRPLNLNKGRQGLVYKHYNFEYELILEPGGSLSFYHGDGIFEEIEEPAGMRLTQGVWQHIAITRTTADKTIRFYLNGQGVGLDTYVKTPHASNYPVVLGHRTDSDFWFAGEMAEVRIWNIARSGAEIQADMYRLLDGSEAGLAGCWQLGADSDSLADELTGRQPAVTLYGSPQLAGESAAALEPWQFAGTLFAEGQPPARLRLNPIPALRAVTIELWFKRDRADDSIEFLTGKGVEELEFHLGGGSGRNGIRFIPTRGVHLDVGPDAFTPGHWVHLAGVYDPQAGVGRVYLNGFEAGAVLRDGPLTLPLQNSGSDFWLGRRGDGSFPLNAHLAEVRVWNRARTEGEIRADMRRRLTGAEPGLVAYWPLANGLGNLAFTFAAGRQNHGELRGPTWLESQWPDLEGIALDGVDDWVDCGSDPALAIAGDLTLELWVRPLNLAKGRQGLLYKHYNYEYELIMEPDGRVSFYHGDGIFEEIDEPTAMHLTQKAWQHIAITRRMSERKIYFYLNGQQVGADEFVKTPQPSNYPVLIGRRGDENMLFNGFITEVRIWNRTRQEAEIRRDMYRSLRGSEAGLVAYWPLTAESIVTRPLAEHERLRVNWWQWFMPVQTANDACGRHHGQIKGGHPAGGALMPPQRPYTFDGQRYIELGAADQLGLTDRDFTVEAWVKGDDFNGDRAILGCDELGENQGLHLIVRQSQPYLGFFANDIAALETLSPGVWYHLAWRYTKDSGEQAIFVNGQVAVATGGHSPFKGSGMVRLGRWGGHNYFQGQLAEVRIWNHPRSQQQISEQMHRRLTGAETGLTAYWPLDKDLDHKIRLLLDVAAENANGGAQRGRSMLKSVRSRAATAPAGGSLTELVDDDPIFSFLHQAKPALKKKLAVRSRSGGSTAPPASPVTGVQAQLSDHAETYIEGQWVHLTDSRHTLLNEQAQQLVDADPDALSSTITEQADKLKSLQSVLAELEPQVTARPDTTALAAAQAQMDSLLAERNQTLAETAAVAIKPKMRVVAQPAASRSLGKPILRRKAVTRSAGSAAAKVEKVEQGMIVFLRGTADVAGVIRLKAVFGLAASGVMGFRTGFHFKADVAQLLDMELKGYIAVNPPGQAQPTDIVQRSPDVFQVIGHSHLRIPIWQHTIMEGDISYLNNTLHFRGRVSLFPPPERLFPPQKYAELWPNGQFIATFVADGEVEGHFSREGFYLSGALDVTLFNIELTHARLLITHQEAHIAAKWLGSSVQLDITKSRNEAGDEGLLLKGMAQISLLGFEAKAGILIDTLAKKVVLAGSIADFSLGSIFRISGKNPGEPATFTLDYNPTNPVFCIAGSVSLLGLTGKTKIHVEKDKFDFFVEGDLFGKFKCSLDAQGRNLAQGGDFLVTVTFDTGDFITRFQANVKQAITALTDGADKGLQQANDDLQAAKEEVRKIDDDIEKRRVQVRAERKALREGLQKFRDDVTRAQGEVNRLQNDINACYNLIHQRNQEIRRLDDNYNNLYWWDKIGAWAGLVYEKGWRLLDIAAQYVSIGALETAKAVAYTALELAKVALSVAEAGIDALPVDADVKIVAYFVDREVKLALLDTCQKIIEGAQAAIKKLAELSKKLLAAVEKLSFEEVSFSAQLQEAKNFKVNITVKGLKFYHSEPFPDLSFDFDFNNPEKSIQTFASQQLLPKIIGK